MSRFERKCVFVVADDKDAIIGRVVERFSTNLDPSKSAIRYEILCLRRLVPRGLNPRGGDKLAQARGITLDGFFSSVRALPHLVKIDIEGSEVAALRGAQGLLSRPDRPAILFEYNPVTLRKSGSLMHTLLDLLPGYALHYLDDLSGQKLPFGEPIQQAEKIDWVCNMFAVP